MLNAYTNLFVNFLTRSWRDINQELLQGALHAPVFRISEGSRTLGSWQALERTLSISGNLLQTRSQLEVLDVLKHEMAHQYADEVLGANECGETAHGSGFRHACRLLGVHHNATMAPKSEPSPVLARIRKLLALAESQNIHEASLAMTRAKELMEKYELEVAEENQEFLYLYLGVPRKQRPAVDQFIASALARHFHVQIVWIPSTFLMTGRQVWLLEACGSATQLEVANYVFDYLQRELEWLWLLHRRGEPSLKGKTVKREYQLGVLRGFMHKLSESETESKPEPGNELVQLKQARLVDFFHSRHPGMRSGRRMSWRESETFKAGFAKGQELEIRKGVKRGKQTLALEKGRLLD